MSLNLGHARPRDFDQPCIPTVGCARDDEPAGSDPRHNWPNRFLPGRAGVSQVARDASERERPFPPRTPYAARRFSSIGRRWTPASRRHAPGNGILFNHEIPRPGRTFVNSQDHACGGAIKNRAANATPNLATSMPRAAGAFSGTFRAMWRDASTAQAGEVTSLRPAKRHGPQFLDKSCQPAHWGLAKFSSKVDTKYFRRRVDLLPRRCDQSARRRSAGRLK